MNIWKTFALFFGLFTIGAIQEIYRISTSSDTDIAENRNSLIVIGMVITLAFTFLTLFFWKKSKSKRTL